MTTLEYLLAGILAGSSAKVLIEQVSQLKSDRARSISNKTGWPLEKVMDLAEIDPTANGSYIEWLAKVVKSGGGNLPADPQQIRTAITSFELLKKIPSFKGNKNILLYPTYEDFDTMVNQSMNVISMAKKEEHVKELFQEIDKRFPYRVVDSHTNLMTDKPVFLSGYYPWLMSLVKKGDIVLPEDGQKVLDVITKFEVKIKDPDFASPKDIARYPTIVSLLNAVTRGETAEVVDRDRIPDAHGVELLATSKRYGHYYELYAVTTPEQASKLFTQANMGRKPDGSVFNGWCVKDPVIFSGPIYQMGPKNPAYMFRRDGLSYALSDIRSGSVMDRDDRPANDTLTVELLGSLQDQMPPNLVDAVINKNAWSRKHYNIIKKNGIDSAVNSIFAKAEGEFGDSSTNSRKAANEAINFMKAFSWTHPTEKALSYIYANSWLATGYATRTIKNWVPELHQVIEKIPAALAGYYDISVRELRLDRSGFPDYKEKALKWAAKGSGLTEDSSACYLPLAMYIRHNPEDINNIDPKLLERIKKDAPNIWDWILKNM